MALAAASVAPGAYIVANYWAITSRIVQVDSVTTAQLALGILLVVLLLEAARRVVGLPIMIIGGVAILYMLFGDKISGLFKGISFSLPEVIEQSFLTDEGNFFPRRLGVSATYVMVFLIFGGFLEKTGVGAYFMDLAQAFTGTQPGGPALIAVTSSCLFGSISGSAVANVYGTGTFTIPLMKKIGYKDYFAGAVEAVASTGGQIMPPVMGAGAFLMAFLPRHALQDDYDRGRPSGPHVLRGRFPDGQARRAQESSPGPGGGGSAGQARRGAEALHDRPARGHPSTSCSLAPRR